MAERQSFWQRMGSFLQAEPSRASVDAPPVTRSKSRSLLNKPLLTDRYELERDEATIDGLFLRLRDRVYAAEASGLRPGVLPRAIRETGIMEPNRLYFFIKPFSQDGVLFERSGAGWVASKADKIVAGDTFIRDSEPLDRVTVFRPSAQEGTLRITSTLLDQDRVSFSIYAQLIAEQIAAIWNEN